MKEGDREVGEVNFYRRERDRDVDEVKLIRDRY